MCFGNSYYFIVTITIKRNSLEKSNEDGFSAAWQESIGGSDEGRVTSGKGLNNEETKGRRVLEQKQTEGTERESTTKHT